MLRKFAAFRIGLSWFFLIIFLLILVSCTKNDSQEDQLKEPVRYVGKLQPDKYFFDGKLPHAIGVHSYQVFRANRRFPSEGGEIGFTYNHQPYLAYWKGKFYLQFLSGRVQEHAPPTRIMLLTSKDGRRWSKPVVLFPEYELPEIQYKGYTIPAGTKSVMHQRMGFYVAPNGRLLASGFYSFSPTPRFSPNKGQGIGRVVREIYPDGSFGPIYFIRYNRHAGWDESNTRFPFYKSSPDQGFVEASDSLLANKLMILQWWEEDRGKDGFFPIDPSQVQDEDPSAREAGVTTSAGAGKAFCFYHLEDNKVVGIWKNGYMATSPDNGKNWSPIVKSTTLWTTGAKTWGQRTADGRYALVYNHSATRRNRFPLVVLTSKNGQDFDNMLVVQGEVPPMRYQGIHKNPGPQYVRGIIEGNGNPPGNEMWITYSMNKEDIWVSRIRVPIQGEVNKPVHQDFEKVKSDANLDLWNLYIPRWAPIGIGQERNGNHFLILSDEAPFDYAKAERIFPKAKQVLIKFRFRVDELRQGGALFVEVQDAWGNRPVHLRIDQNWLSLDHLKVRIDPLPIKMKSWYSVKLKINVKNRIYDLALNGEWQRKDVPFGEDVNTVQRLVFRTGPYRGDVRKWIAEIGEPKTAGLYREDLPGSDEKVALSLFGIDDMVIQTQ